jgi:hypothetical protein
MIETCPEYGDCNFDDDNTCQWTDVNVNTTFNWAINALATTTPSKYEKILNI